MPRTLWSDPTPIVPTDTSGIQAKLDQIIADELVDDATAAALKTVVDAIKIPDISGKADKAEVDAADKKLDTKITALEQGIVNSGTDVEDRLASAEFNLGNLATTITAVDTAQTETARVVGIDLREFNKRLNGVESTVANRDDVAALATRVTATEEANTRQDEAIAKSVPTDAVTPIYEPLPAPVPISVAKSSYTTAATQGTLLVNGGVTHTALRTTGAKIAPNSEQVFVVPAAYISTSAVKIRFALLSAKVGTLLIELDSAPALNASGDGTAWVSDSPSMVVRTDGLWSWFEIVVPSGQNDVYVRFCVPPGTIGAPCIYSANAVTSLVSSVLLGMKLKADGKTLDYRPSDPVATITALTATTGKPLEIRGCLESWTDYVWAQSVLTLSTSSPGTVPSATVNSDWPAFAVVGGYPGKAGTWLPLNARYAPDTNWFTTGSSTFYSRRLAIDEPITSISYEFSDPADINVVGSVSYDAATIASWTVSTFWGGYAKFDSIVMSNGTTVKAMTCVRKPNRDIVLASMNNAGTVFGKVRNVKINGKNADVLDKDSAQDAAIANRALKSDIQYPNLSDWTNAGGNTSLSFTIPYRASAVLSSIEFNLRDRRPDLYDVRNQRIIIPMSYFQDFTNNNWTAWRDGNYDVMWQDFTLQTGAVYRCHIYFQIRPQGLRFYFKVVHSNNENYGYISGFVGKFSLAST
jgi:hypothetical protein